MSQTRETVLRWRGLADAEPATDNQQLATGRRWQHLPIIRLLAAPGPVARSDKSPAADIRRAVAAVFSVALK
jgi:hypothetical protein